MAYDKVVDSSVLDAGLKQIADAIREKAGTSDNLAFPTAMAEAIAAIEAGGGSGYIVEQMTYTPTEDITLASKGSLELGQTSIVNPLAIVAFRINEESKYSSSYIQPYANEFAFYGGAIIGTTVSNIQNPSVAAILRHSSSSTASSKSYTYFPSNNGFFASTSGYSDSVGVKNGKVLLFANSTLKMTAGATFAITIVGE